MAAIIKTAIVRADGGPAPDVLTPGEVAGLFGVNPKTVTRWEKAGRFPPEAVFHTLGGHRRYHRSEIEKLLAGNR